MALTKYVPGVIPNDPFEIPNYLSVELTRLKSMMADGSHSTLTELSADDHPQYHNDARGDARYYTQAQIATLLSAYLLIADIDDTPVNGELAAPISSNWAYDHVAAADPHSGYLLKADIDDTPVNGELAAPISSNWAYDHGAAANPHSVYLLVADIDDTPVNGEVSAPISSNWAYDHVNAADPHTGYLLESLMTTNGDLITRAAGVPARLGIGTNGHVLTVSSGAPAWAAPSSGGLPAPDYTSAEYTIATGGVGGAHGLGAKPKLVQGVLRCKVADKSYAIGDEVALIGGPMPNGNVPVALEWDATNIKAMLYTTGVYLLSKNSTTWSPITNSSWKIVFYAWA